jgi:DNA helicase-2/ATP-dependent DNA helicase PcrA
MRPIDYARKRGREIREQLGASPIDLRARLEAHLWEAHRVSPIRMCAAQVDESSAEVDADTKVLKYDASLADEDLLMAIAHELGHLTLGHRYRDAIPHIDPLLASAYADTGPLAIARYNPRAFEEAQATAFAMEVVAPSGVLWKAWLERTGVTMASLAAEFGCGREIIETQLAHALYAEALGRASPSASRKKVSFTPAQLEAATYIGGPAIVDAGPGTGKTATIINRVEWLVNERRVRPAEVLVVTFSNEAVRELRERIAAVLKEHEADAITVQTFHDFGMELLHLHGHHAGLTDDFGLLNATEQIEMVGGLFGTLPCDQLIDLGAPTRTASRVAEHINHCKQRMIGPADLEAVLGDLTGMGRLEARRYDPARQLIEVFRAYEETKRRRGQVDFADLIALPISVLEQNPAVREGCATRFPWVIVDEFQDVTRAMSRLVRTLCGARNPPWVVGDARQAIYRFAGAAAENVMAFATDFPGARVFELDVNFRSCEEIVKTANHMAGYLQARHGPGAGADLRARWRSGTSVAAIGRKPMSIVETRNIHAEEMAIALQIMDWIKVHGVSPGDIAVLCRRHADVRRLMEHFRWTGIKAQAGGMVTARGAAGDLVAMLRFADAAVGSEESEACRARAVKALGRGRAGARQFVDRGADDIATYAVELAPELAAEAAEVAEQVERMRMLLRQETARESADGFSALAVLLFDHGVYLRSLLGMADSAERQTALVEIVSALSLATGYRAEGRGSANAGDDGEGSNGGNGGDGSISGDGSSRAAWMGFVERLVAHSSRDVPVALPVRPRSDAVHVMTIHAAKGLEFPCVIVAGQNLDAARRERLGWLPDALRQDGSWEEEQARALLFVGVTRAQRAVVVSYLREQKLGG